MIKHNYYVFMSIDGSDRLVGRLFINIDGTRETAAFQYDDGWLSATHAFNIDPELYMAPGMQYASGKMFRVFEDTAPDRWGRTLMQRNEATNAKQENRLPRHLNEIDYIIGVNDTSRQGAIRFKADIDGGFLTPPDQDPIPPLIKLPELLNASESVTETGGKPSDLKILLAPGSSLGGARPKASVTDNDGCLSIAKFPKKDDNTNVVKWEAVALTLAKRAGITVPEFRLEKILDKDVLIIKRFDRDGAKRIPFVSAMTMLGANDNDHVIYNYTDIAHVLIQNGANTDADLAELWRRIAFSVLISNTDDHLRNHGFLRVKNGWVLSPAYDLNPNPETTRMLHTAIINNDASATIDNVMTAAYYFRLTRMQAEKIFEEIVTAVKDWRSVARQYGLANNEIEAMSNAFAWIETEYKA